MGSDSLLAPYRALDLTDEKGFLCGKVLGDLGADVIKVEPPGGEPSRNIGPFYHDIPDPQRSLHWFALNTSKRSLVLDLEAELGRETLRRLVAKSDFIIESFPPGHMDDLGLGYGTLSRLNPGIIMVSITPFGQTGPYSRFKASDMVMMAMGGQMYGAGDPERPPVRVSIPQAYLFGGLHGALGGMLALTYRQRTGWGQWVDVSIREGVLRALAQELSHWEFNRELCPRLGPLRTRGTIKLREVWPCRDGEVTLRVMGGAFRSGMEPLARWMREEGWSGEFAGVDWGSVDILDTLTEETARWQDEIAPFFMTHTKDEIYERALQSRIPVLPCNTPREISEDGQLAYRDFWEEVDHPEQGTSITYPGIPYHFSLTPGRISRRPPLIGEHTDEVLGELAATVWRETASWAGGARASAPKLAPKMALEGIKVADFTWVLAGPLITKSLSDFGATVVKVESGKRLDITRAATPYKDGRPGPDRSGTFRFYNSSKYSLSLDLSRDQGLEVARRLVAWADVVVENFAPGVMEGMGLSYEYLREINPEIVMLSSSNQGQTGPHREHRGFGWNLGGLAGFNHLTGWPDRMGVAPNQAWTDFFSPWFGAVAILGALDYRRRTGKGQYIDLSQYEAGLSFLSVALLEYFANGREPIRQGNRDPRAAPHGAYPCRGDDRWCVMGIFMEDEWRALSQAMGNPGWVRDPKFATLEARKEHESELDPLVAAWTSGLTREEVMARLQGVGVAAGVVEDSRDLLEADPQLKHRGYFQFLDHPEMGPTSHIYWPVHLSLTPAWLRYAPLLGEHTEMVCREFLGMSDGEFQGLKAAGVLV